MANLKTIDGPVMTDSGLDKLLLLLKAKLDSMGSEEEITAINARIDALVGTDDATAAIDTFNEIKAFLSGIEDTDLQSLLSAISTAVSNEATRAGNAETALGNRITTLENIQVMTAQDVQDAWDSVFNPQPEP